ncbi:MAG: PAS domain S-box protein [Chloroflexi bacterium]|nr:PAS domain S-box protein [Chloroflexota bacterium]
MVTSKRSSKDQSANPHICEEKYRIIVENAREGILVMQGGKRIYYNPCWLEIIGYSAEEYEKVLFLSLVHAEDIDSVTVVYENLVSGEEFEPDLEFRLISRSGEIKYLNTKISRIEWEGKPAGMILVNDITERKQWEKQLHHNEARFKAIAANTPDHIVMHDSELRYTMVINPQLGLTEEDMLGKTDHDFLLKEEADILIEAKKKVMESSEPMHFETSLVSQAGEPEFFSGTFMPTFDEQSQPNGLIGYFRNKTESKQAEEKLKASEKRFRALFEQVGDYCMILDPNTEDGIPVILDANEAAYKTHGYTREEFIGRPVADIDDEEGKKLVVERTQMIMSGQPFYVENTHVRKDGTTFPVSVHANRIDIEGELPLIFTTEYDITERKQAEEALIKSEERYRGLVNTLDCGVAIYKVINDGKSGSDYIIQEFNEFSLKHEKMEKADVIGKSLKDIRPNIDEYGLIDMFRNVWKTGEAAFFPAKVYVDDKYSNYYENRVFRLPSGEIVAIYDDVSDRENAIDQIKVSQRRFDLAMKASRDGLFDWNLETNEIYYSPGWKSMLGYEYDEISNDFSVWETNTNPEDVQRSWEMQQELIDKKRDRFELEFKMKHKDGHWVDILSRAEAQFDENGKAVRIIGTHVDITERKLNELALQESEEKFRLLHENAGLGIGYYRSDGTIISFNSIAAKDMNGVPEDFEGKSIFDLFPKESAEFYFDRIQNSINRDEIATYEDFVQLPTQEKWFLSAYTKIVNSNNEIIGIQIISQDITERKQAEDELEKHRNHLEELVKQRTEELQAKMKEKTELFDMMIGREVRMTELKKVIKRLREQLEDNEIIPIANDPLLGDEEG